MESGVRHARQPRQGPPHPDPAAGLLADAAAPLGPRVPMPPRGYGSPRPPRHSCGNADYWPARGTHWPAGQAAVAQGRADRLAALSRGEDPGQAEAALRQALADVELTTERLGLLTGAIAARERETDEAWHQATTALLQRMGQQAAQRLEEATAALASAIPPELAEAVERRAARSRRRADRGHRQASSCPFARWVQLPGRPHRRQNRTHCGRRSRSSPATKSSRCRSVRGARAPSARFRITSPRPLLCSAATVASSRRQTTRRPIIP